MQKETLFDHIAEYYGVSLDYPWAAYSEYAVFRHQKNRKWFALFMPVSAEKLGRSGGVLPIVNVKVRVENVGALRQMQGVLPAHMNKENWVSVVLDEVDDKTVFELLADSFALTE